MQGNLANKNGQGYSFDFGNRLRSVPNESYRYDGLGRRVQTTKTDGSQTLWQYSQAGQMLFSWDGPTAQKTHENVYLGGSLVATIDHDWPSNAVIATKYQHTDALGSPVAVTNTAGVVIERTNYEPYGAAINKTVNGIGYTGHVMDGATGLTYMQQRYYDPGIGRFLSVDPVTASSINGSNFNRYWYANNNPYRFTDPDGRHAAPCKPGNCGASYVGYSITGMDVNSPNFEPRKEERNRTSTVTLGQVSSVPSVNERLGAYTNPDEVSAVVDAHSSGKKVSNVTIETWTGPRYIYTKQLGWVDLKHVTVSGMIRFGDGFSAGLVWEFRQKATYPTSAFAAEDLNSNMMGSIISVRKSFYRDERSLGEIAQALIQRYQPITHDQALRTLQSTGK